MRFVGSSSPAVAPARPPGTAAGGEETARRTAPALGAAFLMVACQKAPPATPPAPSASAASSGSSAPAAKPAPAPSAPEELSPTGEGFVKDELRHRRIGRRKMFRRRPERVFEEVGDDPGALKARLLKELKRCIHLEGIAYFQRVAQVLNNVQDQLPRRFAPPCQGFARVQTERGDRLAPLCGRCDEHSGRRLKR